ncbi:MAG TPA: RNA polymerase sigma factor [Ruminococcaceae bacterium]|nr:RNA polymerase sigma factor [Oscillospiraceae bacterium]
MSESLPHSEKQFEAFYERNYRLVYRLCFIYMKNQAEAEDCTEDVFVKVLTGDFVFQDETHEKKWLTVTAINLCKDRLKHWWRRQVTAIDEAVEIPDENAASFDETLEAVKRLPVKYKDVIYLYYYMDYKTEEIAAMLKKPPSTVRNHLREARECLRRQIGDVEL